MSVYTTCWRNSTLGTSGFRGTFETQGAASEYVQREAAASRSFASYEIWTGTPKQPGKAIEGTLVKGAK